MRSADEEVRVFVVEDIRNYFLAVSSAEKYRTPVIPRDCLCSLESHLCCSQYPTVTLSQQPRAVSHSMEMQQQSKRGAQSRWFSV